MFNFNSLFNRSPENNSSKNGKSLDLEIEKIPEDKEVIENQKEFWSVFLDAKSQFSKIEDALSEGKSLEELKQLNENTDHLDIKNYLKKDNHFISDNLLLKDDYVDRLADYDVFIETLKGFNFSSTGELKRFFEKVDDLFVVKELEN